VPDGALTAPVAPSESGLANAEDDTKNDRLREFDRLDIFVIDQACRLFGGKPAQRSHSAPRRGVDD
jgi:hypothetical protein